MVTLVRAHPEGSVTVLFNLSEQGTVARLPGPGRWSDLLEPAAPVLLRGLTITPTRARYDDFDLALDEEVEVNPVLLHKLASVFGNGVPAADAPALTDVVSPERPCDGGKIGIRKASMFSGQADVVQRVTFSTEGVVVHDDDDERQCRARGCIEIPERQ